MSTEKERRSGIINLKEPRLIRGRGISSAHACGCDQDYKRRLNEIQHLGIRKSGISELGPAVYFTLSPYRQAGT